MKKPIWIIGVGLPAILFAIGFQKRSTPGAWFLLKTDVMSLPLTIKSQTTDLVDSISSESRSAKRTAFAPREAFLDLRSGIDPDDSVTSLITQMNAADENQRNEALHFAELFLREYARSERLRSKPYSERSANRLMASVIRNHETIYQAWIKENPGSAFSAILKEKMGDQS